MDLSRRALLGAVGTLPLSSLARGATSPPVYRLTILHMNDFHSRHEAVNVRALSCTGGDGCFGGSARLATAIRAQREAAQADGRTVLLLDGGDQFQGSLFFTKYRGMAELAVQHAVGTDAMGVGNHEFDQGPAVLAAYAEAARFPLVTSNVETTAEPALDGRLRPWTILERGGLKIGLVGLTTLETPTGSSPGRNVRFRPPGPALERAIAGVRADGAQLVVLMSHMGVLFDRALDVPGATVIIGAHSHTLLSNTEPGAFAPDAQPGPSGALVTQAGAYGRYLGRLDLDLAADGSVLGHGGDCVHVGLETPEDPEVAAIVARFAAPLDAFRHEIVATLPETLDLSTCRFAQCALGQSIAAAMLASAHGAQIALMNAGGIRTGLPAGRVSRGQILEALPFGNSVATVTLTGADLEAALRHGLGQLGRGAFPQWAGLRLTGTGFEVATADGWTALDPAARYLVVTNNFIRNGGDGYTVIRDRGIDPYDSGPGLDDAFVTALAEANRP